MHYEVSLWLTLPFILLLILMAVGPLSFASWWEKHYIKVAVFLADIIVLYYAFGLGAYGRLLETVHNYISFIVFIASLFVVSGGIHINVKGKATPLANVTFLLIGAVLANVMGTTGASMLLIRPWIRMNKHRIAGYHIVFFIFLVSNVGGCLTPVADPPLFLGYLMGVPFWWVFTHCWPFWLIGVGILLAMFAALDVYHYRRAPKETRRYITKHEEWKFDGLRNLIFLGVIFGAVFIEQIPYLREVIMVAAAAAAYYTTHQSVHELNELSFHPVKEVAVLFLGIFLTMMPALDWLQTHARSFGPPSAALIYWASGGFSSVLDSAPAYWTFLSALHTTLVNPPVGTEHIQTASLLAQPSGQLYIMAISIGTVFFGANTYIGNGPNFMVKAIAEHQKIPMPNFFGYIFKYTLPFMTPLLLIVWWLYFK